MNKIPFVEPKPPPITFGQRLAEKVANIVGSWSFIVFQSFILVSWVIWNAVGFLGFSWDPYPFILMNLFLSLQAAYTAPLILIASNRQAEKDRQVLYGDFQVDQHSNSVIRSIHQHLQLQDDKIDLLLKEAGIEQPEEPTPQFDSKPGL